MTDSVTASVVADELQPLLEQLRDAKEVLGDGGADCAYQANKMLEPVLFRLSDLILDLRGVKTDLRGIETDLSKDKNEVMQLHASVVPTADNLGVAVKLDSTPNYEVCVALRDGRIEVELHEDGVDASLASLTYTPPEAIEYEDPNDYVGMGWVGSDGRP